MKSIPDPLDTLTSGLASICRLPGGVTVSEKAVSLDLPPRIRQLYDVENNQDCRKIREMITELDLTVERVIPSAYNSKTFTDDSYEYFLEAGTEIPRMVLSEGNNAQEKLLSGYEEIKAYFDEKYDLVEGGDEENELLNIARNGGGIVACVLRNGRGAEVSPAATNAPRPEKPLVLYSYEGNQFCRLVREVLTELDIVYELRSAGKQSPRREELSRMNSGSSQCPYLLDPNTNVGMLESAEIIKYLYKNYASWTPPNEVLQWTSQYVMSLAKPIFTILAPIQAGSRRENPAEYDRELTQAIEEINELVKEHNVVVYTYDLSPFSMEAKTLLDGLNVEYKEVSLGKEWIPGLISEGGSMTRAALLQKAGQSSLPQIFVAGNAIGGLFSGSPGLVPNLEDEDFIDLLRTPKLVEKK